MNSQANKKSKTLLLLSVGAVVVGFGAWMYQQTSNTDGELGSPLAGLSGKELDDFYACKKTFKHSFTTDEGLGPLYNAGSCYECHGSPGIAGGEGQSLKETDITWIAQLNENSSLAKVPMNKNKYRITSKDVSFLAEKGGPFLYRRSITDNKVKEMEVDCHLEPTRQVPSVQFVSRRHAPPLYGIGLINSVPDDDLDDHEDDANDEDNFLAGRSIDIQDPLTGKLRIGRLGTKAQQPTLTNMVSFMMNAGPAISTPIYPDRVPTADIPRCLLPFLAPEPNDMGKVAARLIYYLSLLAPPPRGKITPAVEQGEIVFEKLQCAFCHTPKMQTAPKVRMIDPNSPAPKFKYHTSEALSDKTISPYSDLLLHYMGEALADGVPQGKASGGEWRTPPLWGLRFRKFLMHDGRATSIESAIKMHDGQASQSQEEFSKLSAEDKADLMSFLNSL